MAYNNHIQLRKPYAWSTGIRSRLPATAVGGRFIDTPRFGELLRSYGVTAGLSQEALAERAGLSPLAISHLERGQRLGPRRATALALAAGLGLSESQTATLDGAARRRRPRPAPAPYPPGLPRGSTTILGREADLAVLPFLLVHGDMRLLTLIGPAGVGKTRLALEVAVVTAPGFADGVTWVDLAPIRAPTLVGPTIATRLGVPADRALDPAGLIEHLQGRRILLVLDNVEQVLSSASLLQELLDACPTLRILATSRVAPALRGERQYAVSPLALPPPGVDDPQAVCSFASVNLFLARARDLLPDLILTHSTAPTIAAICRRLDGLPLAIELAAALVRLVPPSAIWRDWKHRCLLHRRPASDRERRRSTCLGAGAGTGLTATKPCAAHSPGAMSCSARANRRRFAGLRCLPAAGSRRQRPSCWTWQPRRYRQRLQRCGNCHVTGPGARSACIGPCSSVMMTHLC
jgi:transcriptional regulator with XRE-family HTH domain